MRAVLSLSLGLVTALCLGFGGCAPKRVQLLPPAGMSDPDLALADSMAFAEELARYEELTPEERTARQENAADAISSWRQFEEIARHRLAGDEEPNGRPRRDPDPGPVDQLASAALDPGVAQPRHLVNGGDPGHAGEERNGGGSLFHHSIGKNTYAGNTVAAIHMKQNNGVH